MTEYKIIPPSTKRVELHTNKHVNDTIIEKTLNNINKIRNSSNKNDDISKLIEELNREWDTERILEANAAAITLLSIILGFLFSYYWFTFAGFISFFLLVHAVQGWCPPLPIIRRMGKRTPTEINNEKMAIKILRGDFNNIKTTPEQLLNVIEKE